MCRGCGKVVKTGWQVVRPMDALPAAQLSGKIKVIEHKNVCFDALQVWSKTIFHSEFREI